MRQVECGFDMVVMVGIKCLVGVFFLYKGHCAVELLCLIKSQMVEL
jgi:hypothetical protein